MSPTNSPSEKKSTSFIFNMTMAVIAGQVGCLTLVIVLVALFGGLFLDNLMGTKPVLTIGLMVLSIPVTLVAMVWVVRNATSRMRPDSGPKPVLDERGNDR